ncbi:hypothetical protein [Roseimaritima ulvae]|uniref:Uncharacterized protein n=1 Tax=Roseimaritima ulvae TaxID=980254 RepID=A0A5B9QWP1_9BACT|nr:hypothetical protein [Roseimaritima ulvae]QEG42412.1 hypothetical protein UC8_44470 [Roseimaritima ulvae]
MTKIFLPNSDRGQSLRTNPIANVAPPGAKGRAGQEYSGQEKDRRISPRAVFMTKIFLPKFRPGTGTAHHRPNSGEFGYVFLGSYGAGLLGELVSLP